MFCCFALLIGKKTPQKINIDTFFYQSVVLCCKYCMYFVSQTSSKKTGPFCSDQCRFQRYCLHKHSGGLEETLCRSRPFQFLYSYELFTDPVSLFPYTSFHLRVWVLASFHTCNDDVCLFVCMRTPTPIPTCDRDDVSGSEFLPGHRGALGPPLHAGSLPGEGLLRGRLQQLPRCLRDQHPHLQRQGASCQASGGATIASAFAPQP